jgi:succinate dehydrogenase / fumarate reductase cytochrome b subunit
VLHLTQLIGLALGIDPPDLGFDRHAVSVKSVLDKLGL